LGLNGSISAWYPERVSETKEGTNVDIAWQSACGSWTYCDVKLSESDFGTAKDDMRHRDKLQQIYKPTLDPHCSADLLEPAFFFKHYQILRDVSAATAGFRIHRHVSEPRLEFRSHDKA
jgi:hypothetical protein